MPRRIPGSKRRYVDVQLHDAEYVALRSAAARRQISMSALLRKLLERPLNALMRKSDRTAPARQPEA